MNRFAFAAIAAISAAFAFADVEVGEAGTPSEGLVSRERRGFGPWRVSAGGNMGFGLKTKMGFSAPRSSYSTATSQAIGSPSDISERLANGERVSFLGGAFIDPSSGNMSAPYTQNWRIPVSGLDRTTGAMTLNSAQLGGISGSASDSASVYGASLELARTLYAHESGFGVDFAFGVSWMKRNGCFKAKASGTYMDSSSYVYTPSAGSSNYAVLTSPYLQESGGYYGAGGSGGFGPVLDYSDFGAGTIDYSSYTGHYSINATGDYEEWEFAFMLKPWWEVTDFWRLTGTLGLGVTRSEFDYSVSASFGEGGRYVSHKTFDEWRCYGIAGLGSTVRICSFDISLDVLARFCQKDMDIHSESVNGSIEKPDLVLRLALGYEF